MELDVEWSIKLDYTCKLLSQSSDAKDIVEIEKDVTFLNESSSWGSPTFCSYSDIENYIKDDSIRIEVYIKADKVIKSKNI